LGKLHEAPGLYLRGANGAVAPDPHKTKIESIGFIEAFASLKSLKSSFLFSVIKRKESG
jgi:hypothetical protein